MELLDTLAEDGTDYKASTSTTNSWLGSGGEWMEQEENGASKWLNAASASLDHRKNFSVDFSLVRGAKRPKLAKAKNHWSCLCEEGASHSTTVLTLAGSGESYYWPMMNPRKEMNVVWKLHFSTFIKRFFSRRYWRTGDAGRHAEHVPLSSQTRGWFWGRHRGTCSTYHEDVLDERLEHRLDIGKSERHHKVLEMAHRSVESHLPFVTLTNSKQMVRVAKVKIWESLRSLEWTKSQFRVSV